MKSSSCKPNEKLIISHLPPFLSKVWLSLSSGLKLIFHNNNIWFGFQAANTRCAQQPRFHRQQVEHLQEATSSLQNSESTPAVSWISHQSVISASTASSADNVSSF